MTKRLEKAVFLAVFILALRLVAFSQQATGPITAAVTPLLQGGGGASQAVIDVNGIPVNLYRGIASPTIPLVTLPGKDITVPVVLSYDGQGVRVNSVASEVGTGWNVSAGGEISCEVRDEPDENRTDDLGWINDLYSKPGTPSTRNWLRDKVCTSVNNQDFDSEWDIFRLSLPTGVSARFQIVNQQVALLDNPSLIILPSFYQGKIESFSVTDVNGNAYVFGTKERSQIQTTSWRMDGSNVGPGPSHTTAYTSRWCLSSMSNVRGEQVSFSYTNMTLSYNAVTRTEYWPLLWNGSPVTNWGASIYHHVSVFTIQKKCLTQIAGSLGQITFTYDHQRKDAAAQALTMVILRNAFGDVVNRVKLYYSYFLSPGQTQQTAYNSRLRLDRIVRTVQGCAADITSFSYHQSGDVGRSYGNNLYYKQDYNGFYNSNTTGNFMLPTASQPQLSSGDRNPDLDRAKNCILTRIANSSGAVVDLEYGLHTVVGLPSDVFLGPGLRLQAVTVTDDNGHSSRKGIFYTQSVINNFDYQAIFEDWRNIRAYNGAFTWCTVCDGSCYVHLSALFKSSAPIGYQPEDYYCYPEVKVVNENYSKSEFVFSSFIQYPDPVDGGKTKFSTVESSDWTERNDNCVQGYYYTNIPYNYFISGNWDCWDEESPHKKGSYKGLTEQERPFGVRNDNSGYRGLLLERRDYDRNGTQPIQRTVNEWSFHKISETPLSGRFAYEQDFSGGGWPVYSWYYNCKFYRAVSVWPRLESATVESADQKHPAFAQTNGQLTSVTEYEYGTFPQTGFFLPRRVKSYQTDQNNVKNGTLSVLKYPPDLGCVQSSATASHPLIASVRALLQHKALGVPVEMTSYEFTENGAQVVSKAKASTFTVYKDDNGKLLPDKTLRWVSCGSNSCSFIPATCQTTGAGWIIRIDQNYKEGENALAYDNEGNLLASATPDGLNQSQVWGYNRLAIIAQAVSSSTGESVVPVIGHTSFEEGTTSDEWSTPAAYSTEAKTGNRSAIMSKPNAVYGPGKFFTLAPGQQHNKLQFSCWAKLPANAQTSSEMTLVMHLLDGAGAAVYWHGEPFSLEPNQPWQFCKATLNFEDPSIKSAINNMQGLRIQCYAWLTGNEPILLDEYRVHPVEAKMSTQTLKLGVGKTSETNANGVTTYYEYDDNNRLVIVRDEKGNILKRTVYHSREESNELTLNAYVKPGSRTFSGESTYFIADAEQCGSVEYHWNFGDNTTPVVTNLNEQAHVYQNYGSYEVTVVAAARDRAPVEDKFTVQIFEEPFAEVRVVSGSDWVSECDANGISQDVVLQAFPSHGCSNYTYQWQKKSGNSNWNNLYNGSSQSITVPHSVHPSSVYYRCKVTDGCGFSVETDPVNIETVSDPDC